MIKFKMNSLAEMGKKNEKRIYLSDNISIYGKNNGCFECLVYDNDINIVYHLFFDPDYQCFIFDQWLKDDFFNVKNNKLFLEFDFNTTFDDLTKSNIVNLINSSITIHYC